MGKWTYGEEGEAFPVQEGEVWRCGNHEFVCSDLMLSDRFDTWVDEVSYLVFKGPPTLLYCDPPWGTTLLNGFRTKAGKGKATHTWEDLYRRIASIGHARGLPVWVEGSVIESKDGAKIPGTIAGAKYSGYAQVTYYKKHESGLYYNGPIELPMAAFTGQDSDNLPRLVMTQYDSLGVVLDPCAGRGMTSRNAEYHGWASINNELNPHRVSAALARMSKITESEPQRVV